MIIDNDRYPYKLYKLFETIQYHNNLLNVFKKTSKDLSLELEDKGVAYSSNRNTNETINPLLKKYESVKKTLKKN